MDAARPTAACALLGLSTTYCPRGVVDAPSDCAEACAVGRAPVRSRSICAAHQDAICVVDVDAPAARPDARKCLYRALRNATRAPVRPCALLPCGAACDRTSDRAGRDFAVDADHAAVEVERSAVPQGMRRSRAREDKEKRADQRGAEGWSARRPASHTTEAVHQATVHERARRVDPPGISRHSRGSWISRRSWTLGGDTLVGSFGAAVDGRPDGRIGSRRCRQSD